MLINGVIKHTNRKNHCKLILFNTRKNGHELNNKCSWMNRGTKTPKEDSSREDKRCGEKGR